MGAVYDARPSCGAHHKKACAFDLMTGLSGLARGVRAVLLLTFRGAKLFCIESIPHAAEDEKDRLRQRDADEGDLITLSIHGKSPQKDSRCKDVAGDRSRKS